MSSELAQILLKTRPNDLSRQLQNYACVAVILRGPPANLELGFIQRSTVLSDRWAGQIAFPGGKKEDADLSDLAVALRETFEEIGLDLLPEEMMRSEEHTSELQSH